MNRKSIRSYDKMPCALVTAACWLSSAGLCLAVAPATLAQTSSIEVTSNGDVGIGTSTPSTDLHIVGNTLMVSANDANSDRLTVQNTSTVNTVRQLLDLVNDNGPAQFRIRNVAAGSPGRWALTAGSGSFSVSAASSGSPAFRVDDSGNLEIGGLLTENSSRSIKAGFERIDGAEVLARVEQLPILTWSYEGAPDVRHIGPMAEDFHALFGFGKDDTRIAPSDKAGVALLAIQGLHAVVEDKDRQIAELNRRIEELEALVEGLIVSRAEDLWSGPGSGDRRGLATLPSE